MGHFCYTHFWVPDPPPFQYFPASPTPNPLRYANEDAVFSTGHASPLLVGAPLLFLDVMFVPIPRNPLQCTVHSG